MTTIKLHNADDEKFVVLYIVTNFVRGTLYEATLHTEKENALARCQKLDEYFEERHISVLTEHGKIYESDSPDDPVACTRYEVPESGRGDQLWILHIVSGDHGGECYGVEHDLYLGVKEDMINILMDCYDDEHNRDDASSPEDCKYCKRKSRKKCAKRFAERFSRKHHGNLSYSVFARLFPVMPVK